MSKWQKTCILSVMVVGCGLIAYGNGYKILCVKSTKATAMGEAFIVQADDPSAVAFNPAGMAQLTGTLAKVDATLCNAYTDYESPAGHTAHNEDQWQVVPAFFITSDLGLDKVVLGMGVSFPNGLSSEWGEDSFARYVTTYSDLTVADLSPAVGMHLTDRLMIGAGLDYYYSTARLEKMVDYGLLIGAPGRMDIRSKLDGSGSAWGFNAGAIYKLNERHSVAATYRHPYEIDYDGDFTLAGARYDATATMDFPAVVVVGYAYRPADRWKIEFDLDWTYWDDVKDIAVNIDSPVIPSEPQKQDLENTFAYKLGVEYAYSKPLALRCGYIYNENATPEDTWRPSLPDTVTHFLTAGFGYTIKKVTIDGALQFVYYEKRTIDNNVDNNELKSSSSIDGTYRTWAPCLSLSATYRF